MAKILHLPQETAISYSEIKKSIDFMKKNNEDGLYTDQIGREKNVLRYYLDQITSGR